MIRGAGFGCLVTLQGLRSLCLVVEVVQSIDILAHGVQDYAEIIYSGQIRLTDGSNWQVLI